MPENIKINITENGTATLRTSGKICLTDIDVVIDVPSAQMPELWDGSFVFVADTASTDYYTDGYFWSNDDGNFFAKGDYVYWLEGGGITTVFLATEDKLSEFNIDINYPATTKDKSSYGSILEEVNGEPVTRMYETFQGCAALEVAPKIPNNMVYMDNAFEFCTALRSTPHLPESVQSMYATFSGCTALKTIVNIPNNVTNLSYTFCVCESLEGSVTIGIESVDSIDATGCFDGVDMSKLTLVGTGSNNDVLEVLGSTGMNWEVNSGSSISLMHEFEEFDPIVISGITEGMTWRDLAEVNDDVYIDDYTDYEPGYTAADYAVSYYYEGRYYYIYQCGPGTYVQPDDIIIINDYSYFYNDISPSM